MYHEDLSIFHWYMSNVGDPLFIKKKQILLSLYGNKVEIKKRQSCFKTRENVSYMIVIIVVKLNNI